MCRSPATSGIVCIQGAGCIKWCLQYARAVSIGHPSLIWSHTHSIAQAASAQLLHHQLPVGEELHLATSGFRTLIFGQVEPYRCAAADRIFCHIDQTREESHALCIYACSNQFSCLILFCQS